MTMPLLKRKSTNPVSDLEVRRADLTARRAALEGRLQEAAGLLAQATDQRRQSLLDSDLSDEQASGRRSTAVRIASDRHDEIRDALRELGIHIAEVEAELIAARSAGEQKEAADIVERKRAAFASASAKLASAVSELRPALDELIATMNVNPDFAPCANLLLSELLHGFEQLDSDAHQHIVMLHAGTAHPRRSAPVQPVPVMDSPAEILHPKKGLPPSFRETIGAPRPYIGVVQR